MTDDELEAWSKTMCDEKVGAARMRTIRLIRLYPEAVIVQLLDDMILFMASTMASTREDKERAVLVGYTGFADAVEKRLDDMLEAQRKDDDS